MDYKKIQSELKALINDNTSPEVAESIGKIGGMVEDAENEFNALVESKNDLRKKYVEAVKNSSFGGEPQPEVEKPKTPKTFEDCVNDVSSQK